MQIVTNQFQKELKKHGSDAFPFLVSYERLAAYESGSFLWHWHPEIEITYVQKGAICYKINHCCYHLKEGDILFGNANTLHAGSMEQMQDCEYISITFLPKLLYGFYENTIRYKYTEPLIQDFSLPAMPVDGSRAWHRTFKELVKKLIRLDKEHPDFYELDIVITLQTLWKILLQNYVPTSSYTPHDKLDFERIKKIVTYIEQNFMYKITLKNIADQIHLCESECSRLFKRYMNLSLFSFLQEYRIERSLEYLGGGGSISEIAEKVGFSDSNYYSKVFTKLKGCSPRQYRKKRI